MGLCPDTCSGFHRGFGGFVLLLVSQLVQLFLDLGDLLLGRSQANLQIFTLGFEVFQIVPFDIL